jgi:hypothetical protein
VRAADGFRILIEHEGAERAVGADVVLDCTGTYGNPAWLGPGGAPAVGERQLRDWIEYGLPDVTGTDRSLYSGKRTLVVGGGHSAATTILLLRDLAAEVPGTSFVWATRSKTEQPVAAVQRDSLPARAELIERANAVACDPPQGSAWEAGVEVVALDGDGTGPLLVTLMKQGEARQESFDRVIANVGFEPADSLYRQLQVHECYASRGPMKLSAALLAARGDGVADCLELGGFGPDFLKNPEPCYFILGMKSYGKGADFLLRIGYEQVSDVVAMLSESYPAEVGER